MTEIPSALGLAPERVAALLEAAGRAPSLHNTQPWRFRLSPHVVELHADRERRLAVADPDGREMRIACGAALFNLRMALHGEGVKPLVTVLPDAARPDLVAVVRRGGTRPATPEQRELLRAVPLRRTNRHPFDDGPVDPPALHALRRAAQEEGAWLHLVEDRAQRAALQRLVVEAHRTQVEDPAFRAEIARWTAVTPGRRDGVPESAGGPAPAPQDRWVLRDFSRGQAPPRPPGHDFEDEPAIAVLTAHIPGPAADVQIGQALERVLLRATADGLAVSLLSEVVEVARTREELRRLISATRPPAAVLRIGRGWPVAATARREVTELLAPEAVTR